MEQLLYSASERNELSEIEALLQGNSPVDVNWGNDKGWTAMHIACREGHDSIVSALLAHPGVNVNQKTNGGNTPFFLSCSRGRTTVVQVMLRDSRVAINEPNNLGYTALVWAAYNGYLDVIQWLVASGRELDLGHEGNSRTDAESQARKKWRAEVVVFLQRYKKSPEETRYQVRMELGVKDALAAELFALVVFLSDDYVGLRPSGSNEARARFFAMARQLPMELQMLLCHRAVESPLSNVSMRDSNAAFRDLVRRW